MTAHAQHRDGGVVPTLHVLDIPQSHQVGELRGVGKGDEFWLTTTISQLHCNLAGNCSGGVTATLFDIAMGLACCSHLQRLFALPTVSMVLDYMAPVPLGASPLLKARMVRATRSLGFTEAQLFHEGRPCVRGTAIFALPRAGQAAAGPLDMIYRQTG